MSAERTYTIRQLCQEFACTPRALRFYEDKGLLSPARAGLNRIYSYKDRARLMLILRGKRVGLPLAEIGELLDLYELDDGGVAQTATSLGKCRERITALERQRIDIDNAIAELKLGALELEQRLATMGPEHLPKAADYDQALRLRLDGVEHEGSH